MTNYRLRPVSAADVAIMTDIERALFPESPWSEETLAMEIVQPLRCYLLLEVDGRPVGYGGIWLNRPAEIMTIGILPAYQGRGFGRMLLEALLVKAIGAECAEVFLEVRVDNHSAIGLYRSMGFETVRVRRRYYQPEDVDAYQMRLDLAVEPFNDAGPLGRRP